MAETEWKKKYETAHKESEKLKQVAQKVTQDYDELYSKFTTNENKYAELCVRLQNTEEDYKKLQKLVEPALGEYQELNTRYEIERGCRTVAQDFATKVNFQNTKLKRQSQQLLDTVAAKNMSMEEIKAITEEGADDADMVPEEQNKHWNDMIEGLNEQIAGLNRQLLMSREEYAAALQRMEQAEEEVLKERALREQYQRSVEQHQASLQQYKRVSMRAFDEYQDLKERYETEAQLKEKAETYASEMYNEKKIAQRQSTLMMQQNPPSETLQTALLEIEDLKKELHEEQTKNKKRTSQLEGLLEESKEMEKWTELETKLEEAASEITELQKQVGEMEERQQTLEKDNSELVEKLQAAEKKLEAPPPPPPPPPPPLPSANFFKPVNTMAKKKEILSKSVPQTALAGSDNYNQALEEMMAKIKSGQSLRPKNRRRPELDLSHLTRQASEPSLPDSIPPPQFGKAMTELETMVKRNRSASSGELSFGHLSPGAVSNGTGAQNPRKGPKSPASKSPASKSPASKSPASRSPPARSPVNSNPAIPSAAIPKQMNSSSSTSVGSGVSTSTPPSQAATLNVVLASRSNQKAGVKPGNIKAMKSIFEKQDGQR